MIQTKVSGPLLATGFEIMGDEHNVCLAIVLHLLHNCGIRPDNLSMLHKKTRKRMAPLYGLVACGGNSSRMGYDKSMITYHKLSQRYHTYHLLEPFCENIFISCNAQQASTILSGYNIIVDAEGTQQTGPMAALVSAFEQFPEASFLLIGCDYPFLLPRDIAKLVSARRPDEAAVCYINKAGIEEPLIAIYEKSIRQTLMEEFNRGRYSLRSLLQFVNAVHCSAFSQIRIRSINDRKTFDSIRMNRSGNLHFLT